MSTDWESCYVEGNTPWDKGRPSPPLVSWVARFRPQGKALVPGCGIGHDVVMLHQAGLDATGVDLSPTAIRRAGARYPELAERFVLADLFLLPAEWAASFDWVVEHTCLCALPPALRQAYAKAVHGLLKPGGRLAGIWFINPEMDVGEEGPPFALPLSELEALFPSAIWEVEVDEIPAEAYEGREGRERLRILRKIS